VTVRLASPSLAQLADDDLVDVHMIAKAFGCSARTIMRSDIPYIAIGPHTRRYRVVDVRRWLAEHVRSRGAA
jgi:hypothetical protein